MYPKQTKSLVMQILLRSLAIKCHRKDCKISIDDRSLVSEECVVVFGLVAKIIQ